MYTQLCLTLCDSMDYSPPGSSVYGISQARTLEWVAISFSRGIFSIQGSNLSLLYWQVESSPLNHQGKPEKPELGLKNNLEMSIASSSNNFC